MLIMMIIIRIILMIIIIMIIIRINNNDTYCPTNADCVPAAIALAAARPIIVIKYNAFC